MGINTGRPSKIDSEEVRETLEDVGLPEEIAEAFQPLMDAQIQTAEYQEKTAVAVNELAEESRRQRRHNIALIIMTGALLVITLFLAASQTGLV